jgi:hypothetical protein
MRIRTSMHFYQIRHCAHLCGDEAYISGGQLMDKRGYCLAASKKKKTPRIDRREPWAGMIEKGVVTGQMYWAAIVSPSGMRGLQQCCKPAIGPHHRMRWSGCSCVGEET